METIVRERGNGMADVGDYVSGDDGQVYLVESIGRTCTGLRPGMGAWARATVCLADWSDVTDETDPVCYCDAPTEAEL